jgi:hypothetical protein
MHVSSASRLHLYFPLRGQATMSWKLPNVGQSSGLAAPPPQFFDKEIAKMLITPNLYVNKMSKKTSRICTTKKIIK